LFLAYRTLSKKYQSFADRYGIPVAQLGALQKLWKEDDLSISELGTRMGLAPGSVTELVDRMKQNGYVSRVRLKSDRRVVKVRLSAKGQGLRRIVPSFSEEINVLLRRKLSEEEMVLLVALLRKAYQALEEDWEVQKSSGIKEFFTENASSGR